MDPVNGLSQIAQILRQKLSERSSTSAAKAPASFSSAADASVSTEAKASAEEIKRKIGERIRALSDEERRGRKAVQVFVEAVMMWEFGEQLLQDPQFTELSKEVVKAMTENPVVWTKLQALLSELEK